MPATIKIRVVEGRDLPVMDRTSESTDAYVEVKFGDVVQKTEIAKRTLNPVWVRLLCARALSLQCK
jgi:Ca2+-dependent lipid-binding protein